MSSGSPQYLLWRRDGHGNSFLMCRFHSRQQAERTCLRYQNRGHKQNYWITVLHPLAPGERPRVKKGTVTG